MKAYEVTATMNLKNIIAESREVAQALNKFADELEQIEKKYADPQESEECLSIIFPECRYCTHHTLRCMPKDRVCGKCVKDDIKALPSEYQQKEYQNGQR